MLTTDLHVHLDGSLRDSTLLELARSHGVCPSDEDGDAFVAGLTFEEGMTLQSCLDRFTATVGLLQSRAALCRAADELVRDCYLDGVRHAEIRFCPLLHTRAGLDVNEALEAVVAGIDRGVAACQRGSDDEWMSAGVIVSILEGSTENDAKLLCDLAIHHAGSGVLGIDLAGDESLFDAKRYRSTFMLARAAGLGVTVHAGEGCEPSHIRDAVLKLGADRIGHGTSAARDMSVVELLAKSGTAVECCLTSNLHTGAIASLAEHPLPLFLKEGVRATLATDNRFFSRTTVSGEYDLAAEALGIEREDLVRMAVEGGRSSFLESGERGRLVEVLSESAAAEGGNSVNETRKSGPGRGDRGVEDNQR